MEHKLKIGKMLTFGRWVGVKTYLQHRDTWLWGAPFWEWMSSDDGEGPTCLLTAGAHEAALRCWGRRDSFLSESWWQSSSHRPPFLSTPLRPTWPGDRGSRPSTAGAGEGCMVAPHVARPAGARPWIWFATPSSGVSRTSLFKARTCCFKMFYYKASFKKCSAR